MRDDKMKLTQMKPADEFGHLKSSNVLAPDTYRARLGRS
jgi:hypothetical protein